MSISNQIMARTAFECISKRGNLSDEYRSFALAFPALIHQSGLIQAVSFALAKKKEKLDVANDVVSVINSMASEDIIDAQDFHKAHLLDSKLSDYAILTHRSVQAATWIKRYTEAMKSHDDANKDENEVTEA